MQNEWLVSIWNTTVGWNGLSSRSQDFHNTTVLKSFRKLTWKHLWRKSILVSLNRLTICNSTKSYTPLWMYLWEFPENFRNTHFWEKLWTVASQKNGTFITNLILVEVMVMVRVRVMVCKKNAKLHPVPYFIIKQRYIFTCSNRRYCLVILFVIKLHAQSNIET